MEKDFTELTREDEVFPILDSKLITPTLKNYDIKLIDCGDYVQVYYYLVSKNKKINDNDNNELKLKKTKLKKYEENEIELQPQEIMELFEGNYNIDSRELGHSKVSTTLDVYLHKKKRVTSTLTKRFKFLVLPWQVIKNISQFIITLFM